MSQENTFGRPLPFLKEISRSDPSPVSHLQRNFPDQALSQLVT